MPRRKKSSHENHSRSSLSINKEKPQQRYAANARERARMRVLSRAFCRLKTTLPWVPADTKLSKLDTLRLAGSYIAHLKGILREETLGSSDSALHPAMSLTWPFGFNRPLGGSSGGGSQEGGSLEASEDEDDDDEGSISSCTWEEVTPTAKDCVHLEERGSRARGKGNHNSQNSQAQQHHYQNRDMMGHQLLQSENKLVALNPGIITGNNVGNAPPPLTAVSAPQNDVLVGVGISSNVGNNESFVTDMGNMYTPHSMHHHHHQPQSEHHHLASSVPFGFGSDLISIG